MSLRSSFNRLFIIGCFFLSGFSGLVFEVAWTRKLGLILGSTTLSVSLVLSAYLGGLALGAYLIGRRADQFRAPATIYGLLELGIGIYGALSLRILDASAPLYARLIHLIPSPSVGSALGEFGLVSLVLIIPTVLMGGSLPVLVRASASSAGIGLRAGRLYAANTGGAVFGAAVAGFILLPRLGLQQTVLTAAYINVLIGLVVIGFFQRRAAESSAKAEFGPRLDIPFNQADSTGQRGRNLPVLGLIVLSSGFCALFYEVIWTRILELIVGSSTWAFSLMLTTFLLGLSLGIALGAWLSSRIRSDLFGLGMVQIGVGLSILLSLSVLPLLPDWIFDLYLRVHGRTLLFLLGQAGLCAAMLLLPATLMGTIFPLVVELTAPAHTREAREIGQLYALNTLGCIAGALLAGLVLIPGIGLQNSLRVGVWINLGLATVLLATMWKRTTRLWRLVALCAAIAGTAAWNHNTRAWNPLNMTSGLYLYAPDVLNTGIKLYHAAVNASTVLFYKEGSVGTVAVIQRPTGQVLSIDGRAEGSNHAVSQTLLGHLPFALNRSVQDVLVIGFGTGSTVGAVTAYPVRRIDVAELEPAVIEASQLFENINHKPLSDSRVHMLVGDARNLLLVTPPASYDLIICQPSNPWVSGSSKLFTQEFYALVKDRLRPTGILAQWIQLSRVDMSSVMTMLKTITNVLPQALVFYAGGTSEELLLIAGQTPHMLDWPALVHMVEDPITSADLHRIGIQSPSRLLANLWVGPDDARRMTADAPINTDDNGLVEFAALRNLHRESGQTNMAQLRRSGTVTPWTVVANGPDGAALQQVLLQAAELLLKDNDFERGIAFAREAVRLKPTAATYQVLGDYLYVQQSKGDGIEAWRQALALDASNQIALGRLVRHYSALPTRSRPAEFLQWCAQVPKGAC